MMLHIHQKFAQGLPHHIFSAWPQLTELLSGTMWQREKRSCSSTGCFLKLPTRSDTHHFCTPFTGQIKLPGQPVHEAGRSTVLLERVRKYTSYHVSNLHHQTTPKIHLKTWIIHSYFVFEWNLQGEVPNVLICYY